MIMKYSINERIKFNMAVEGAKILGECADRERRGSCFAFKKMLHYTGGNPPWLHRSRPKKNQMHIMHGRRGRR